MKTTLLAVSALLASGFTRATGSLPSAVYGSPAHTAKKEGGRQHQQLAKGSTLDLAKLEIYTETLQPGQANHPLQADKDAEELVVVQAGRLAATIRDSAKTLSAGGVMLVMAGDKQTLQNTSAAPASYCVLRFQAKDAVNSQRAQAGGGSCLQDWPTFKVTKTDKGETRPVFDRPSSMFKRFDVHATVLNAGKASHLPHTHRAEELILMTSGNGEMLIGEKSHKAAAGDVILLRANVPHAFTNTGSQPCGYFAIQWHSEAER